MFGVAAAHRISEKGASSRGALFKLHKGRCMDADVVKAVFLGIVEGVTAFLPVSSTGHLLLVERFFNLGEDNFWKSFVILIQLGDILAIVCLYLAKLWRAAIGMFTDPLNRRFVRDVL